MSRVSKAVTKRLATRVNQCTRMLHPSSRVTRVSGYISGTIDGTSARILNMITQLERVCAVNVLHGIASRRDGTGTSDGTSARKVF